MRRHGCGCALANAGHDTRAIQVWTQNIQHAVRYTELTPDRFKDFCAFDWQLRQSQDDGWRWSPRLALERYCG